MHPPLPELLQGRLWDVVRCAGKGEDLGQMSNFLYTDDSELKESTWSILSGCSMKMLMPYHHLLVVCSLSSASLDREWPFP